MGSLENITWGEVREWQGEHYFMNEKRIQECEKALEDILT